MRKIATCCYCGTRAALILRGDDRHELSCAACGAPLREMKAVPCETKARGKARPGLARRPAPHPYDLRYEDNEVRRRAEYEAARQPMRRRKKRKPLFRKALEEIWDVVEDILD